MIIFYWQYYARYSRVVQNIVTLYYYVIITEKRKLFHFAVLTMIFDSPIDLLRTDNFPTALCYVMTFCVPRTSSCLVRPDARRLHLLSNCFQKYILHRSDRIRVGFPRRPYCTFSIDHNSYYYYRLQLWSVCHRVAVCGPIICQRFLFAAFLSR